MNRHAARPLRAQRGSTLIEMMMTVFVIALVTSAILGLTSTANRTADRRVREESMGGFARASLDEMLKELRAADQIFVSRTIAGTNYATTASNLVLEAPGFDPASTQGILPGIYDVVAFTFDATARTLSETTFVDTGSRRPARSNFVIARNVQSVAYTYRVREQFVSKGVASFVMSTPTASTPVAYVDGRLAAGSYVASTRTFTLSSTPASGKDVQFLYAINPTANSGAGLAFVNSVDVTLVLSEMDGRRITRTVTMSGNARLRNQRT